MSLQTRPIPSIPHLTAKIARRAARKGNVYMQSTTWFSGDCVMTIGTVLAGVVGNWLIRCWKMGMNCCSHLKF